MNSIETTDYLALGELEKRVVQDLVKGLADKTVVITSYKKGYHDYGGEEIEIRYLKKDYHEKSKDKNK